MARRASSGISPAIIIGAVVLIALVVIGGKMMLGGKASKFGDSEPLSVEDLQKNGNQLQNNVYVVEGEIDEKLEITDRGQLVSVKVDGPKGDAFIGIVIPSEFDHLNISNKQKYVFLVKFRQGGIAVAQDIERH